MHADVPRSLSTAAYALVTAITPSRGPLPPDATDAHCFKVFNQWVLRNTKPVSPSSKEPQRVEFQPETAWMGNPHSERENIQILKNPHSVLLFIL